MKIGDKVITHQKERGIIIKPWVRKDKLYDWWIEIEFKSKGKDYKGQIPYRENELEVLND